jgi:uncharacterized protein YndB with AHSA1/START domain
MKNNTTAIVRININAPIDKIWEALTNPEIIKQYFFGTQTITDWKPGSPIIFEGEWQGKKYRDKGRILEVDDQKLIKYNYWSSVSGIEDKPENYVIISYMITGSDNNVTLSIKQENIPGEKMKEHSQENWKKVLEGLKQVVEEKMVHAAV